ncbi:MAG: glycoside hydrolase family 78 protein [Bacteroidales bacterium]|nr:glycoside hydrolase family 78 protein [Bacteroidales bacterium]
MDQSLWEGKWISDANHSAYKPAPYFRKKLTIKKEITSARAYVVAAGLFELSVNGVKVSDRMLEPMYTTFNRRNLYVTFDLSSKLLRGENAVGMLLGNGWYNHQSTAVWDYEKAVWRNRPRFLMMIRITYKDGSFETISTDSSWKTTDSPVIFNSIYTAEHDDARREIPDWNKPAFNDANWQQATIVDAPSSHWVSEQLQPIRVTATLKPVKVVTINDSCYLFCFGRNIAGITDVRAKGESGTVLRIRHGERLNKDGFLDMTNIDYHFRPTDDKDPFQTDIFILKDGQNHFSPKFNYKGFQYVEISSSRPIRLDNLNIQALEMHSDLPAVGFIKSSNELINKINAGCISSYLANMFGYPTDCPQREKNGWTGDAHIAIETGLYNFDGITVYEKWLQDFKDVQRPDGVLPAIIPTASWGYGWANGTDWTSAVAIIPWEIYRFTGDDRLLKTMYDPIKLYVDHITSISKGYLTDWGLGDWVPVSTVSNITLTSSLYYYNDVLILSKAAMMLNRQKDAAFYADLAKKIKQAINDKFLDRKKAIYCSGSQTELATALYWGVVPDEMKKAVAANLYKKVEATQFHLDVGLLGAKALLCALSENGYGAAAYKIATQDTYPSWGYWFASGATTFHENWKIDVLKDNSYNHIMFGQVGAWFYKGLGGIYPDEKAPGFKHTILKPFFPEGLSEFEASHRSPYGMVTSKWKREGKKVTYQVLIPGNTTATLYLPANVDGNTKPQTIGSGKYTFKLTVQ